MINFSNSFAAVSKRLLPFFLMTFLFACKKDIKSNGDTAEPDFISASTTSGPGGTNCYSYTALIPEPDGQTYTGYVENVPISVTNIIKQLYDDYGNPVTYQQGDAFVGQINLTSTYPAEVLYNTLNPQDDQFSIRIYQMGATILDLVSYSHDMEAWSVQQGGYPVSNNQWSLTKSLFNQLQYTKHPDLGNYLKPPTGGVTYHDVTARLIRINPTQVLCSDGVFRNTEYAIAPTCYPRNDLRQGTTGGQATLALRNAFFSTGATDITVDFIQNGNITITRTFNFPTTPNTTSVAFDITPGTYTLQFKIPAAYASNYYGFGLSPIGFNSKGFWDTSTGSVSTFPDGHKTLVTQPFTFSSGTAYTLRGLDTEP